MALPDLISRAPRAWDRARSSAIDLPEELARGSSGELLRGTAGSSPYLCRLIERHRDWLAARWYEPLDQIIPDLIAEVRDCTEDTKRLMAALREAKSKGALIIALADLGGAWDLPQVTGTLTALADGLTQHAAQQLLTAEIQRGKLPGMTEDDLANGAGYVVIAMGKHGARELNYSSDIDLICLFDQDRFDPKDFAEAKARYIRVTRDLVKLLSEQTEAGYVFRTDLRLRPSPSTTPVCLAMEAAERYYESVGRTWERAAHIKARPIAGDLAAGTAYLEDLTPFVWRRYLDFAAIEDTHEMLRKIRAKKGVFRPSEIPGHDLKLGPGGIREIEFFAQTRQLIMGGRLPHLREPTTCGALTALAQQGLITQSAAQTLIEDYTAHRTLEHRLQMIEDAQTHAIPLAGDARERVAALAGYDDLAAFETDVATRLERVHATTEEFFAPRPGTGDGTRTLDEETLAEAGFTRPGDACRTIDRWRSGRIAATRTERAQKLFRGLEPQIVAELSRASSPDDAIAEFDRFISGLPAGVQVFSLFQANPQILELIVEICAAAPRLAIHLGHEPQALDALLAQDFFAPFPDAATLRADLQNWLAGASDYEEALDQTRRWAREQHFRAGVQILRAVADQAETGRAFTGIAEVCLRALLPEVIKNFAERHGLPPGNGIAVIGLGKLGTFEMTAGSDLDLITVYDPADAEMSEGLKPLPVQTYYPRLTQALLAALTAPTAEGRLYEVDMRLRPSGRQGPVSVSLSSFQRYQTEQAWVWEHLALTRARVVAGPDTLARAIEHIIDTVLTTRRGDPAVMPEAREMHSKLVNAHQSSEADPWALKHTKGGLMEIEFLTQTGVLLHGLARARPAREGLAALAKAGWIDPKAADDLVQGLDLMQRLQQVERVALEDPIDPGTAGDGLRRALCRAANVETFDALSVALADHQARAREIIGRLFSE